MVLLEAWLATINMAVTINREEAMEDTVLAMALVRMVIAIVEDGEVPIMDIDRGSCFTTNLCVLSSLAKMEI